MKKTDEQWFEEAESFRDEFHAATGRNPILLDVINECREIGIENYIEYAKTLYEYMNMEG